MYKRQGLSDATPQQLYQAVARTVRDEVMRRRPASRGVRKTERKKKVYYLCAEFLTCLLYTSTAPSALARGLLRRFAGAAWQGALDLREQLRDHFDDAVHRSVGLRRQETHLSAADDDETHRCV